MSLTVGSSHLNGYKVIIHKPVPKLQLSEDCPVSDDFRIEINAWLIDFFGYEKDSIIDSGDIIMLHASREMIMSQETHTKLYNHLQLS